VFKEILGLLGGGLSLFGKGSDEGSSGSSPLGDALGAVLMGLSMPGSPYLRMNPRQREQYNQERQVFNTESLALQDQLMNLNAQRLASLDQNIGRQISAVQNVGNQARADVGSRYNAMQGRTGQQLGASGLYNSTVAPGMRALVERERGAAMNRVNEQQSAMLSNIYGNRAQSLDAVTAAGNQIAMGMGDLRLAPQRNLAMSLSQPQQYSRPGSLVRLFS
jgi:hypothetical protein